ncbi:MAG: acetyl-CoA decarbonylase/synthase complex subunit gamma [Spirochaetales bacterium]|nr:acetyl-CoA decarbonylase/synthase complex subunit gamma [Spirochaetales bacterium]
MALTGMDIYKQLPKTNCKDCGLPTCMAFAMQVAAKQKNLTDCPHLSDQAKTTLSEASEPPMKLVTIGTGDKACKTGRETVMFRHEEKFHNSTLIAIRLKASLNDGDALKTVEKINEARFIRVGETLKLHLFAVELDGCSDPVARVKAVAEKSLLSLILIGNDANVMKDCVDAVKAQKPMIYGANASNIDAMAGVAASAKVPLAVSGGSNEELADLAQKAKDKGAEEIVLCFKGDKPGQTLRDLTSARRVCLKKNFRALGYPAMVDLNGFSEEAEPIFASVFSIKYGGIVIVNGTEPWQYLPILTSIQDIYTDPQVPNTVEAKLYEIGSPGDDAPVLFTTNFALTYFSVAGEVERSKIPAYISVVDTEGLGVLNSYAGDKISPEKVVKTLAAQKANEKVKHHKLIIPGLLPIYKGEIEDISEWKEVIIGPETSREIPAFLHKTWK